MNDCDFIGDGVKTYITDRFYEQVYLQLEEGIFYLQTYKVWNIDELFTDILSFNLCWLSRFNCEFPHFGM